jgi:hypothetical protein
LNGVGLEGVLEHLVHLGDEDELDVLLGLLGDVVEVLPDALGEDDRA